jgi:uncharacterized protein (DUF1800 family)
MRQLKSGWIMLAVLALAGCGGGGAPAATSTPPVAASKADAVRFLEQSSFGPTPAAVASVQQIGLPAYLDLQLNMPATGYPGHGYQSPNSKVGCPTGAPATCFRDNYTLFPLQAQFFRNAITGQDQLRQRVAFALSQILVTSGTDINQPYAMAAYQQILLEDAFSTYRQLLEDVTLSPAMGRYLDTVNNDKTDAARGTSPNENYGREINQLFSIGLLQLNADGTPKLDGNSQPITTYTQDTVEGFSSAFTGWTYPPAVPANSRWTNPPYFLGRMVPFAGHHEPGTKLLLNGVIVPAGGDPVSDLKAALDSIANHPNVGPFIGKQLIQFLVSSNPSPAYVARITAVFNDDGSGVRGNLKAVVRAILLDPEARGDSKTDAGYGRLRDPDQFMVGVIRGLNGSSDGVALVGASKTLEQQPFDASSVFSFYPPDFPLPGSNLVAPSFGVFTASTAFSRANLIRKLLAGPIAPDSSVTGATGTRVDLSSWQTAAVDAGTLADRIDELFFHGSMPSAMRNLLIQTVNGIAATDTASRAKAALYLALSSTQYQVEQ